MSKSDTPKSQSQEISDLGQISRFRPPDGWLERGQSQSEWGQRSYSRDFSPADDAAAVLSVYFRGYLISESSAQKFRALLEEPPHELTSQEINSINQVLSKLADEDAFEKRKISTLELSGRRALIIDGEWKTSQTQFHGLMIEADRSGREIQEVFFEAPVASFTRYLNDVVDSIRTINWKGL